VSKADKLDVLAGLLAILLLVAVVAWLG